MLRLSACLSGFFLLFTIKVFAQDAASLALALVPYPDQVTMGKAGEQVTVGSTLKVYAPAQWKSGLLAWDQQLAGKGVKLVWQKSVSSAQVVFGVLPQKQASAPVSVAKGPLKTPLAHEIIIEQGRVNVRAASATAAFNAGQTLLQLLTPTSAGFSLPALRITDGQVAMPWRGLHLDVARHFMPLTYVRQLLDWMAFYKLNVLHLHLTDDQGWRMEIKGYPKLTSIGAVRKRSRLNHSREKQGQYEEQVYGGYYTQAELKQLVAYAAARHIIIVPEVDMPGHMQAAIAAYPWLGSLPHGLAPPQVWEDWGVSKHILAPTDSVLQFVRTVMDQVAEVFPSPYLHIGGDEAEKDYWKELPAAQERIKANGLKGEEALQAWFLRQVHKHVATKHKRELVGWDEVLEGGLKEATIMSWRGTKGGISAALAGQPVVMSPGFPLYLDAYQAKPKDAEPLAIGGMNTLKNIYQFNPVPDTVRKMGKAYLILGVQGNVWTEYLRTPEAVTYMVFPRIAALAELGWRSQPGADWSAFKGRVKQHASWWQQAGLNYSKTGLDME